MTFAKLHIVEILSSSHVKSDIRLAIYPEVCGVHSHGTSLI